MRSGKGYGDITFSQVESMPGEDGGGVELVGRLVKPSIAISPRLVPEEHCYRRHDDGCPYCLVRHVDDDGESRTRHCDISLRRGHVMRIVHGTEG